MRGPTAIPRASIRLAVAGLAVVSVSGVVAGCGPAATSDPPSPSAGPAAATPSAAPATRSPEPSPQPSPSPHEIPSSPPPARVAGRDGTAVDGMLGTYVWAGTVSDSPWLPGTPLPVEAGADLVVDLASLPDVGSWTIRLAPVGASGSGLVASAEGDGGAPVGITLPPIGGPWEMAVEVRFADGSEAAWFWRVETA